jgi:hypothetical protein
VERSTFLIQAKNETAMNKHLTQRTTLLTAPVAALLLALAAVSPLWAQSTSARPAEADRLHVVLLVAGHDSGIGNADLKDIAAMKRTIDTAFANDKKRVAYHDLTGINAKTGKAFTANEILAHLRNLKIGPNDNVLVYHSGHGGIADKNRPEETHILTVDGGQLNRKDIRTNLSAKRPRALMILTDCCSSFMNAPRALFPELEQAAPASVNVATVRNLLLKPIGIVNITAAKDGTEAKAGSNGPNPGQAGSAFTVALMRLWYRHDATFTSWEQLFPVLRTETLKASGGAHQARAFRISTQAGTPVAAQPAERFN